MNNDDDIKPKPSRPVLIDWGDEPVVTKKKALKPLNNPHATHSNVIAQHNEQIKQQEQENAHGIVKPASNQNAPEQERPIPTAPYPEVSNNTQAGALPQSFVLEVPYNNPLIKAASSVFIFLGKFKERGVDMQAERLINTMIASIRRYQQDATQKGISAETGNEAGYILAATIDDVVYNSQKLKGYPKNAVTSRLFGCREAGERFFEKLNTTLKNPILNYDLLELMHGCLALGFVGGKRIGQDGMREHQQIQRDLYDTLRRVKPKLQKDISPHWKGKDMPLRPPSMRIPLWAVMGLVAALLLAMYLNYLRQLSDTVSGVTGAMAQTFPTTDVEVKKTLLATIPTPSNTPVYLCPGDIRTPQLERICEALRPEIEQRALTVESTSGTIVIRVVTRVNSPAFFPLGKANVVEEFQPIILKIGQTLKPEPGGIMITGHTDNTPIRTARFASNLDLSIARAKAITALLSDIITQPKRMNVDGKGDTAPLTSNATTDGRARNRRVDIQIPHEALVKSETPFKGELKDNRP